MTNGLPIVGDVLRKRVLLVSPFVYGEKAAHGGGVVCFAQLQQLSKHHELSFIGFSGIYSAESEAKDKASLEGYCSAVTLVPFSISKLDVLLARLKSLVMLNPELAGLCYSQQIAAALLGEIQRFKPDIIWIQFPQMAQYVQLCGDIPTVMDVQDAYTLSGFRQAQGMRGSQGVRAWLDWVCWARYEAACYRQFSAVLTLSEQDATILRAMSPGVQARSMGLPLSENTPQPAQPVPLQVGFAGAFGHRPNREGLRWFLDAVWPLVIARLPDARFVVAGRNPPPEFTQRTDSGVEFAGFVPDIFAFYSACAVTVIPLTSGGGVKIKTAEAMLSGSALVSTTIGVEGTGAQAERDLLIEDEPAAFAEAVVRVLSDTDLRMRLANSARGLATDGFSAAAWRGCVAAVFSRISEGRHA